jgi:two-component system sensor histidine kinase KdpD
VAAGNLRSAAASDALRRDQIGVIEVEVTRLNRLFQNIVDMARIETGAIDAEREWVHPADIVDAAVRQVQHTLQDHPLELDVDTPESAQVDPRLTATALAHLLENAGQYAPSGTPITITAKINDAGLTLSVRDRGPGIAPQDVEHLFEEFFRGTGARHRSFGTGMGLAITRGLLAAEGGRVWAENHPDGGACFTLHIPASARQGSPAGGGPS